jgi:hypothetical protein
MKPTWKYGVGDLVGCGILVNREDKVGIFFTGNGKLIGKFIHLHKVGTEYTNLENFVEKKLIDIKARK